MKWKIGATNSSAANTAVIHKMQFRATKKRSAPSVIIVSLIDVLMVVLIFLVVSTTFKDRVPALDLSLPTSQHAGSAIAESDEPLSIQILEEAPHLRLNNRTLTLREIRTLLQQRAQANPHVNLNIQADKNAPFGEVIGVRDAAQSAGITNIHAQVRLPSGR